MKNNLRVVRVEAKKFFNREEGQDLVEYALLIAMIGLGSVVTMRTLAGHIITAFDNIGTTVASSI